MKYYINSISMLCADGKWHEWKPMDMEKEFDCSVDESQIRGGYGNVPTPRSRAELDWYIKLKERNDDNN